MEELKLDLDQWMDEYNSEQPQNGRYCFGKTPMQTLLESRELVKEKMMAQLYHKEEISS